VIGKLIDKFQSKPDKPLLKRRLIRDVYPHLVNETLEELEENGFEILAVYPRTAMIQTKKGPEMMAIYDILVSGESDPLWGSWSNRHG
jgi:hypothetical protein